MTLPRREIANADDRSLRALRLYAGLNGAVGLVVSGATVPLAWPGTTNVSPWADLLALPVLVLLVVGLALLIRGRLNRLLLGGDGSPVADGPVRRTIGVQMACWAAVATTVTVTGPDAAELQFALAIAGVALALRCLVGSVARPGSGSPAGRRRRRNSCGG